tara:strand:- start:14353 stop:15009 length:657 start_codon:yes stop_codon:yes gene_type:complete
MNNLSSGNNSAATDLNKAAAVLALGAIFAAGSAYLASRHHRRTGPHDSAPGRTHRRSFGEYEVVGKTVTINRPRSELYAFWRDFQNLPKFMENIENVQLTGKEGRAVWTIRAPAGQSVEIETEVVQERKNELIAWRSVKGSEIETEGRVKFRDAPANRGTWVEAIVAYKPPGGTIGKMIAKLFAREPEIQARRDLKRLKMFMETGEIADARHYEERSE